MGAAGSVVPAPISEDEVGRGDGVAGEGAGGRRSGGGDDSGSGLSKTVFSGIADEALLPSDASDLRTMEEAKDKVVKLRSLLSELHSEIVFDKKKRNDILSSTKLLKESFRVESLNALLKKSASFVDLILEEGYEYVHPEERYPGMKTLQSFLNSPALAITLARNNMQEEVRQRVADANDSEISKYIGGLYANSTAINDVSLVVRERAKSKFRSALIKLKGQMIINKMIQSQRSADVQDSSRQRTVSFFVNSVHLTRLKIDERTKIKLESVVKEMGDLGIDFDVFRLVPLTNNQPLLLCGMELFKRWNLDTSLNLKDEMMCRFFSALEAGYHSNPYHSSIHAADVMYTMSCFMNTSAFMRDSLDQTDIFAALVAAAAHDFRHDGVNNAFHVNTSSDLALRYNDISVLESMHSAELFTLCKKDSQVNIFDGLSKTQFREIRKIITNAILGTDMSKHFNHIADFKSKLQAERAIMSNGELDADTISEQRLDKHIVIDMALHCADVSNPVKDIKIYKKWVLAVMTEFYMQGDLERELKLPISPMFDRNNPTVSKTQLGFIDFIIRPIYNVWGDFMPELNDKFQRNLDIGKEFDWDDFYSSKMSSSDGSTKSILDIIQSCDDEKGCCKDFLSMEGKSYDDKRQKERLSESDTETESSGAETPTVASPPPVNSEEAKVW